jgi:hypothetical protein
VELREFYLNGLPFGRSVVSQLQTVKRETFLQNEDVITLGNKILANAIKFHLYFLEVIDSHNFGKAIVFGGRYAAERSLLFAAQKSEIQFETFETGASRDKIWLSDVGETSFYSYQRDIMKKGLEPKAPFREKALEQGRHYLEEWTGGGSTDPNYLNPNLLNDLNYLEIYPERLKTQVATPKKKLVVFTSTNYEVIAFDDFKILDSFEYTQIDIIKKFNEENEVLEKYDVFVRWHPNSLYSGIRDLQDIQDCIKTSQRLIHIPADSKVNSYSLMKDCDAIVVFGSTIGIEAASKGKPVFLLGNASYSGIGAVYEPSNFEELLNLLRNLPKESPIEKALLWANWKATFGEVFNYLFFEAATGGYYMGNKRVRAVSLRLEIRLNFLKHKFKEKVYLLHKKFTKFSD